MQERRNYYRILGVQPDASVDVIRGVYRTLMQKLRMHPDLGGDVRDAASINEAWRILRDASARQAYDRQLLSDYDIRLVGAGGNPVTEPDSGAGPNRRNYYRVLALQPDAPQALIDSAYRAMSADVSLDRELIAEAYAVLGNPQRRRHYDDDSDPVPWVDPEADTGPGVSTAAAYNPVIRTYCVFCKSPHSPYPGRSVTDRCLECNSPLQRPEGSVDGADRTFQRSGMTGVVTFFEYWPGPAMPARLTDFTPDGLRLTASKKLEPGQIVRVSAKSFDAVARVVHCASDDGAYSSGMALLTVSFYSSGIVDLKT